jgi:hypothetical protein
MSSEETDSSVWKSLSTLHFMMSPMFWVPLTRPLKNHPSFSGFS